MLPDDAYQWPIASDLSDCLDCGGPLSPGRKLRCNECVAAAHKAIERAGPGVTVRPSDVERQRAR